VMQQHLLASLAAQKEPLLPQRPIAAVMPMAARLLLMLQVIVMSHACLPESLCLTAQIAVEFLARTWLQGQEYEISC